MKYKIIIVILALFLCLAFQGCSMEAEPQEPNADLTKIESRLIPIENNKHLYYDQNTKIVYIIFSMHAYSVGYGYMSVYYASNGLPYLYDVENKILIEIN